MDSAPIAQYRPPKKGKQRRAPKLTYSLEFEEREAAAAAGMSYAEFLALPGIDDWIDPDHPTDSKASVIVWYRNHQLVEQLQKGF